jgi:hypothetical protein
VAIPYYPPHPITDRLALTIFPDARPIRAEAAPVGVNTTILAASSKDSYLLPTPLAAGGAVSAEARDAPRGAAVLAVAVEGRWPDALGDETKPFRLVLGGRLKEERLRRLRAAGRRRNDYCFSRRKRIGLAGGGCERKQFCPVRAGLGRV